MNQETKNYIEEIQATFPRLKLFEVKKGGGYEITGKFGILQKH